MGLYREGQKRNGIWNYYFDWKFVDGSCNLEIFLFPF